MNRRDTAPPSDIPNAWNAFGNVDSWLPDSACSAEIMLLRLPSFAPPASARIRVRHSKRIQPAGKAPQNDMTPLASASHDKYSHSNHTRRYIEM